MAFYWAIMTFFALRSEATHVSGRFCKRRWQQSKQSVPKWIAAHPGRQPARILHVQQNRLDMSSAILQRYVVKLVKLQDLAERLLSCGADCGWQSKAYRYFRPSLRLQSSQAARHSSTQPASWHIADSCNMLPDHEASRCENPHNMGFASA